MEIKCYAINAAPRSNPGGMMETNIDWMPTRPFECPEEYVVVSQTENEYVVEKRENIQARVDELIEVRNLICHPCQSGRPFLNDNKTEHISRAKNDGGILLPDAAERQCRCDRVIHDRIEFYNSLLRK